MIDFDKELRKFQFMDLDEDFIHMQNESSMVIKAFQNTLKRFDKEQSKANLQLEEIMELVEEERNTSLDMEKLDKGLSASEDEKAVLVNGLIAILDQIEDLYRFSEKRIDNSWSDQLNLLWNNITNELLSMGIMKIDGKNAQYNKNLQLAVEVRYCPELDEGIVLEVLRCGYGYKNNILRKAKVIVNKKEDLEE